MTMLWQSLVQVECLCDFPLYHYNHCQGKSGSGLDLHTSLYPSYNHVQLTLLAYEKESRQYNQQLYTKNVTKTADQNLVHTSSAGETSVIGGICFACWCITIHCCEAKSFQIIFHAGVTSQPILRENLNENL